MILFIYLGRGVPPILRLLPAGFCAICLLWADAPIQSTLLQWQSQTEHTHPRTLARTYNPPHLSRRVCSPRLARPLPAARTHIVSHRRPPPILSPPTAPRVSPAFSETFSHFHFLLLPVWISLIYLWIAVSLCLRVHLLINLSLPVPVFPFISGLIPPREKENRGAQGQEPDPSAFGFHYKQTSTSQKKNNHREKNERKRLGAQRLVI